MTTLFRKKLLHWQWKFCYKKIFEKYLKKVLTKIDRRGIIKKYLEEKIKFQSKLVIKTREKHIIKRAKNY